MNLVAWRWLLLGSLIAAAPASGRECAYVAAAGLGSLVVIDLDAREVVGVVPAGERPSAVVVSAAGDRVYVTDTDGGRLYAMDTASNRSAGDLAIGQQPLGLHLSPDAAQLYVANRASGDVAIVDTATLAIDGRIRTSAGASGIAVDGTGTRAWTANQIAGSVSELDLVGARTTRSVGVGEGPFFVALSTGGDLLWVSNVASGDISIIDVDALRVVETLEVGGFPSDIVVHPDGERVFVGNVPGDGHLAVFDAASRQMIDSVQVEEFGALGGAALGADGERLYVAEFGLGNVFIIDLAAFEVLDFVSVGGGSALEDIAVAEIDGGCGSTACDGDCNGDGEVRIGELVRAVAIALGRSVLGTCPRADLDFDGRISIAELVRMVNRAVHGCNIAGSEQLGADRAANLGKRLHPQMNTDQHR